MTEQEQVEVFEIDITEDEFLQWKKDRITRQIFKMLKKIRDAYREDLANGLPLDYDNPAKTGMVMAKITGTIEGLEIFLDLKASNSSFEGDVEDVIRSIGDDERSSGFVGDSGLGQGVG